MHAGAQLAFFMQNSQGFPAYGMVPPMLLGLPPGDRLFTPPYLMCQYEKQTYSEAISQVTWSRTTLIITVLISLPFVSSPPVLRD